MSADQQIVTFLWCDGFAEEQMNHYVSIFKNSKVIGITRWGDTGPGPKGSVLTVTYELNGQRFMAVNGGPMFKYSEAVSLLINCDTQDEIDYFWSRLTEGGTESRCGWLKDKFGLSWQVAPRALGKFLNDKDPQKANRAMAAMMQMSKMDLGKLQAAFDGR